MYCWSQLCAMPEFFPGHTEPVFLRVEPLRWSLSAWSSAQDWLRGATAQACVKRCHPVWPPKSQLLFPTGSPWPIMDTDPEPRPLLLSLVQAVGTSRSTWKILISGFTYSYAIILWKVPMPRHCCQRKSVLFDEHRPNPSPQMASRGPQLSMEVRSPCQS